MFLEAALRGAPSGFVLDNGPESGLASPTQSETEFLSSGSLLRFAPECSLKPEKRSLSAISKKNQF